MKILVNKLALEYRDEGAGPVVLMLHGWKDDLHTFDPLVAQIAQKFRVVRLDLPGFGGSELPSSAWNLDDYVDCVAAFVDKLHLNVDALVGHSFGGRIAIKGISRAALDTKKVILIASAGVAKRNTGRAAAMHALAKVAKLATLPLPRRVRIELRDLFYAKLKSDYANAGELRETFKNIIGEDLSSAAAGINTPTLLIWGSSDDQTPLDEGVRLSKLIKGSEFKLIQAAGHFVHREHSTEVARMIEQFI